MPRGRHKSFGLSPDGQLAVETIIAKCIEYAVTGRVNDLLNQNLGDLTNKTVRTEKTTNLGPKGGKAIAGWVTVGVFGAGTLVNGARSGDEAMKSLGVLIIDGAIVGGVGHYLVTAIRSYGKFADVVSRIFAMAKDRYDNTIKDNTFHTETDGLAYVSFRNDCQVLLGTHPDAARLMGLNDNRIEKTSELQLAWHVINSACRNGLLPAELTSGRDSAGGPGLV